jgi:hypothetical protein
MTDPKRHHFVPKFYLDRFADGDQRALVRPRDGAAYVSNTTNVAVESGFYHYENEAGERVTELEGQLSDLEGKAAEVLRKIDESRVPPEIGGDDRRILSDYMALQMGRTPEHREASLFSMGVYEYLDGRPLTRELVADYLEYRHLGFTPSSGEVTGALDYCGYLLGAGFQVTQAMSFESMQDAASKASPILHGMSWSIEHERKGHFITSDTPVMMGRTPSPRDTYEGFGIKTCEEIRFPLDPAKQLVLSHSHRSPSVRVSPERSTSCNQDVAYACHQLVVATPNAQSRVGGLDLPPRRPVLRFNTGPLIREQSDGSSVVTSEEVIHMWVPRR